jgi:beta-lactamase superfamily II metal-dependent hydrolase
MHSTTISQMMGYLLITENGKVIAVDGGTKGDAGEFKRLICQYGSHIDLWILTHPHSDHMGVFWELVEHPTDITVDCICYSLAEENFIAVEGNIRNDIPYFRDMLERSQYPMRVVKVNDTFWIDNLTIEILRVVNSAVKKDYINNLSVVFKVTEEISAARRFTMMFLGDMGETGGEELLGAYAEKLSVLKADAVQMAHHGQCGVGLPVYQAIAPKWAFWPTPDWLWTNTPEGCAPGSGPWKTLEVRAWMDELGARPVTCTEKHVEFDSDRCVVQFVEA